MTHRMVSCVALVAALVALAAEPPAPAATRIAPHVAVGAIPSIVPMLRNAAALGTLVRIDPKRRLAEFRVSCGWYYSPKRKVHRGLWKIDLTHLSFGWEANPANPASPNAAVTPISLRAWEHRAELRGWSGTLSLAGHAGDLSNGPTTNICAGVLG